MEIIINGNHVCRIDKKDFKLISKHNWRGDKKKCGKVYARSTCSKFYMHRVIKNAKKGLVVDHKNGNTLDNRNRNLRTCSHKNNLANQRVQKRNKSSKFKGVCFSTRNGKWRAYINKSGKQHYLGFFKLEKDAAKAYDKKAKELFGEYACLNFN